MALAGRELILAVTGSIAAYKAAYLLRELRRAEAGVTVVMTAAAREFVAPLTFRTLSARPVLTDLFDPQEPAAVEHVALAERADLTVVAPATAHALARAALGLADDFLGTLLLAVRGPVLFAPAMDGGMWDHPAVRAHVGTLRARGAAVLEPGHGDLASGLHGQGRFPEVADIVETAVRLLWPRRDLAGDHVLVTAGPTREPLDPVRYLTNRSSGRMGYAIAAQAARRGAVVTLVTGPTHLPPPPGIRVIPVQTAIEMRDAVLHAAGAATIVIKAAAVADYQASRPATEKIRSRQEGLTLDLTPTPDILQELSARKESRFLVGFAAETHELREHARAKLVAKGVDLIVANDVSRTDIGFDATDNEVVLLDRWGGVVALPRRPKVEVADLILDRVEELRRAVREPQAAT
ncbi:MAG TPA: bifunctional phosphopantothenoylcysteine decarboxylase/phosphopantothenate--cysteine ligase CoaBC [Methylomirabilota bacterium]|jgi:phosphopantothenoylcysteine decarboxylase/phosphopantothenate--cysteine ligase|nr:bifunctional phosphopantothenoylcysteine decarboxylase/phosphopantothenate--cysteine ligase CoaBC [Methylomirabilota bacterium]